MPSEVSDYEHLRERAKIAATNPGRRRQRFPIDPTADPYDAPLETLNVANPELFKHDVVHGYFKRLRDEAPVHFCPESQYGPYWSVTRYADIMAVDKNHHVFSSDFSLGGVTIQGTPSASNEVQMFIQMDPPKHDVQRAAVAPMFTQRSLAKLEAVIRQRVVAILDGLPVGETFDWVPHVSVDLTGRMLATLFDVPQEDRHRLIHWSNIISNADNPEYLASAGEYWEALAECGDYFQALWQRKRTGTPSFDLLSMLASRAETSTPSSRELLGNVVLLLVGGNDTTRNSISGGVIALNEFPEEAAKLWREPALVPTMVPEIIRWQTPLTHMRRTAVADFTLHGQTIRQGDRVIMWYLSGNRDERAIDEPNRFIIDRPRPREHLSFGFGIHRCLGNRLAEMQLRVLWEELLDRYAAVEVVGAAERANSPLFRAIQSLPVCLHAR